MEAKKWLAILTTHTQSMGTDTLLRGMETLRIPLMFQPPKAVCKTAPLLEAETAQNCLAKMKLPKSA